MTDSSNMDRLNRLEAELAAMKPTAMPSEVMTGIEKSLATHSTRWADRCLMAAMGLGFVSTCAIVVLLLYGEGFAPMRAVPNFSNDQQILAGAQIAWVDQNK